MIKQKAAKAEKAKQPEQAEGTEKATKPWHEGKKTYAALAGVLASMIISVAGRHGLDLGPDVVGIADAMTVLLTALAGWARNASAKS